MGKIRKVSSIIIMVILLTSVSALLMHSVSCTSDQGTTESPSIKSPDKGNPKMDSQLNQLVSAEARGEAASFAEKSGIKLVNGNVRVIIECISGQLEAATQAATNAGAKVEASYDNLLQVVVPVVNLSTLSDAESIHFIRLPQQPLSAPEN